MDTNWAAEHLQTIRTLMERSALYRRALAPIFTFVGTVGIIAAPLGSAFGIETTAAFALYWMAVCVAVIGGALMLVRKQALRSAEKFWSPPTRRIAQAMLPALLAGVVAGLFVVAGFGAADASAPAVLALVWTLLYGLALHAAGFFTPRGVRWFGWGFLLVGLTLLGLRWFGDFAWARRLPPHWLMGVLFGVSHLACGAYLYFTEPRKNEA
jgi:hypothetical protein